MKIQVNPIEDANGTEKPTEIEYISIEIPEDFMEMTLQERIDYVARKLKEKEEKFPVLKDNLMRKTSLVKFEDNKLIYAVGYLPYMDNEY
jgi:hypothetical protein